VAAGAVRTGAQLGVGVGARRGDLDPHLAAVIGLSPSRVHQIVADADLDALDAAVSELRAAGWPAPNTPTAMRTPTWTVAITSPTACRTRWTGCGSARAGSGSSTGGGYPPTVNLRPAADWPDRAVVTVGLAQVAAVIDRIAADVDELARARRAGDLDTAAVLPDRRAERRRRLAEPDLEFRAFCARRGLPASSTPQLERAWDAWQAERYRRGETGQRPGYTDNPFRPR
jgi:hypothetical protein